MIINLPIELVTALKIKLKFCHFFFSFKGVREKKFDHLLILDRY